MNTKELGQRIRKRRKDLKLRQADLSLTTGIGMRFISNLENGKPTCEVGKTLEIVEALGLIISIDER